MPWVTLADSAVKSRTGCPRIIRQAADAEWRYRNGQLGLTFGPMRRFRADAPWYACLRKCGREIPCGLLGQVAAGWLPNRGARVPGSKHSGK